MLLFSHVDFRSASTWFLWALTLELSAFLMKNQLFYDGNKRIAMLAANQVLISHGCGVLSVSQEKLESFFTLLVRYYEDESAKEELLQFLYGCIDGFREKRDRNL